MLTEHAIFVYKSKSDSSVSGVVPLEGSCIDYISSKTFRVVTQFGKSAEFTTSSKSEAAEWYKLISTTITSKEA